MRTSPRRSKSRPSTRATSIGSRTEIARDRAQESLRLPLDLDYRTVRGFSAEVQHKLNLHRPETIGQAARISGSYAGGDLAAARASEARTRDAVAAREESAVSSPRDTAADRRDAARVNDTLDLDAACAARCSRGRWRVVAAGCARQARRVHRSAREVESHVQPDGDPRARAHGHASRARRARRAAAPSARRQARVELVRARRRQRRRRAGDSAGDRAARRGASSRSTAATRRARSCSRR